MRLALSFPKLCRLFVFELAEWTYDANTPAHCDFSLSIFLSSASMSLTVAPLQSPSFFMADSRRSIKRMPFILVGFYFCMYVLCLAGQCQHRRRFTFAQPVAWYLEGRELHLQRCNDRIPSSDNSEGSKPTEGVVARRHRSRKFEFRPGCVRASTCMYVRTCILLPSYLCP